MEIHYSLDQLPKFRSAVITIGSFDGIHLGHRQLLGRVAKIAERHGGESVAITFDPHPRSVIYPKDQSLRLLTTTREKTEIMAECGIDHLVVVPFTVEFSRLSADEYITAFLQHYFQPEVIVIGYDHRFGLNRQGNVDYLRWHGEKLGFKVVQIEAQEVEKITVSSTKIRQALSGGNIAKANALLGHPFPLTGTVVSGRKLGRDLGFPTANISVSDPHKIIPAPGIYVARAKWGNRLLEGMLYIGDRPSLADDNTLTIELNIFDFNRDIYGEELKVFLLERLREDEKFDGLDGLTQQLQKDEIAARDYLQDNPAGPSIPPTETAIVILNYNGLDFLQRFLPGLLDSLVPGARVVIADNRSTDDSVTWLKREHSGLEIIELPQNYGFAGGYNKALEHVTADVYVLLNSDVEVQAGWLTPCLDILENDPSVAAVQPKILSQSRRDHFEYAGASGGWIDALGYPFCRGRVFAHTEKDLGQYDQPQEIFWASGAALFVRAELFHRIGGFEAEYFAHAEEIDLCWRLKRAGYRILVEPASVVYHVGGGTLTYNTPRKTYLNFRNTLATSFKNESRGKLFWWLPLRLLLDGLAGLLFLSQGNFSHIGAIIRAHFHFYPRFGFWLRRRRERKAQIEQVRIGPNRVHLGRLRDSIIWHYYLRGNKHFAEIVPPQHIYSVETKASAD